MSIRLVPRMISGPLDTRLYRIVHAVIAPVVKTIFRMRITGLENLPKDGPIVLASNHVTNADPVFVGVACPRMVHFMAKAEIWKVPLLGRLVSRVGAFPVRRGGADREAVRTALRILKGGAVMGMFPEGRRQTLGPLIHNPAVIEELVSRGVDLVESVESVDGGTVIIRSHGIPQADKDMLDASDAQIVDATCTFVKAAQEKAARLRDQGYLVIVLGEPSHPEVLGIRSYAGPDSLVVQGPEDLPKRLPRSKVGVVVQTTQPRTRLSALVAELALRTRELLVCNTICNATHRRQRAAVETAESVDLVLVIGGRNSGNTTRLSELCAEVQPKTYHIESAEEIQDEWLEDVASVGVTAGASTPADQIGAVLARLEGMGGIR